MTQHSEFTHGNLLKLLWGKGGEEQKYLKNQNVSEKRPVFPAACGEKHDVSHTGAVSQTGCTQHSGRGPTPPQGHMEDRHAGKGIPPAGLGWGGGVP